MVGEFIEQDCTISHEGQQFTAGGAWLSPCSDGFWRGVVYADVQGRRVTDWHGNEIVLAEFGRVYHGNYCRMQAISFVVDGLRFAGRYCPDTGTAVRVRSTVRVSRQVRK